MVRPHGQWLGIVSASQLFLDLRNLAFFHKKKIGVEIGGIVVVLVVADAGKVAQDPGQRIWTGAEDMADEMVESRIRMG